MNSLSSNVTLKETAYQFIKKNIVEGKWDGGTFLSENLLCEQLNMSKTPIRSALDRLEMMGLVKQFPKQGVVVSEVSLQKILQIYELRKALEAYAVKRLTGKLGDGFFEQMDENICLQEALIEKEDIAEYVQMDRQFHMMIINGMENEEYAAAMTRIQDQFLLAVRTTFLKNKQRLAGSIEEHRQIRHALAGNDPELTERLMIEHIEYVKQIML
ncbi:GntR family transcriptional regulator [Paenibacillus psychroresistens]|uniref:GntR family transcriptional regulator n=1 Tax=Paenibacillus psychroresistens TaxID=1778678 RepID=A0A6B8RRF6_9BACL|nr:GntR family transcriptional regulator [Paenibacillus psychroresistens]QGQ98292.1 GntR family transcriptional regulator [Paenibacillus psychroresistens]